MLRRYDVSHPPPFKTVISFFFFHGWGGHPFAAGVGRSRGGREGRKRKREESKSCLKGFTQRVSADCLQLPSAPPVVSLATVFPNLSAASLPPSLPPSPARSLHPPPPPSQTHSIDASPECVAPVSRGPFAQLLGSRRPYSFRVHVSVRYGCVCQPLTAHFVKARVPPL